MTSREGYDAYCLYLAINNHFNTDSYDYFKYAGKTSVKLETFLKRKDKYHFAKLARKYHTELKDFYVANLYKGKYYVKNLLDVECEQNYKEYKKRKQQLTYAINKDCNYLYKKYETVDELLGVNGGQHSNLLKEYLGDNIAAETFIAFDLVFGVIKEYDKDIQEKFIWPKKKIQLRKLSGFIEMEQRKILTIMRGLWKE
tara:strand:+ start:414 stop:1010 length:597 start_codon:yes stop_codon:yes gene_type:complete